MKGFEDVEREISSSVRRIKRCLAEVSRALSATRAALTRLRAEYEPMHSNLSQQNLKPPEPTRNNSRVRSTSVKPNTATHE